RFFAYFAVEFFQAIYGVPPLPSFLGWRFWRGFRMLVGAWSSPSGSSSFIEWSTEPGGGSLLLTPAARRRDAALVPIGVSPPSSILTTPRWRLTAITRCLRASNTGRGLGMP